ncbi:GNAT family N-acetyltransferase [Siphonobacter curvatus]|uniref:GNAT family N-acetyltransferase n=1 Tax=Siphonobacter curvatus TaxID=2094562 RepID=A0A2S7IJP2_9BACT|nr:GNAT family N-acetyltransferase [Siphonobacter curvatus]PQA56863.1 GNAT family N-acetyltransferase [Siphonobacter curvatus]
MVIQHQDNGKNGKFYVEVAEVSEAEMTYLWSGEQRIISDHTEVSDVLQGQQVGKQLVQAAVDFAREKQIKILPLCPFANAVFKKTPDFQDVLF